MRAMSKSEFDVMAMSQEDRDALFDELYLVYDEIFDGYKRADFQANFESTDVAESRLQIIRNASSEIVGFNGVRLSREDISGNRHDVYRSVAGMKKTYRGGSSTIMFGLKLAAAHKFKHPFRSVHYFGLLLHPSSYYVLNKYAHRAWPRHDRPTPPSVDGLINHLADSRGYKFDTPPTPYVRLASEMTRETEDEPQSWRDSNNPIIQFYIKTNPRYADGRGLITLIPLNWSNLCQSALKFAIAMTARKLGIGKRRR